MASPATDDELRVLLARLLARYLLDDGLGQVEAAKLIGIRTATFAELASTVLEQIALSRSAYMHLLREFYRAFPECDQRAVRQESIPWRRMEPRMYTDEELLTPPHLKTWKQVRAQSGNREGTPVVKLSMGFDEDSNPDD